FPLSNPTSRAEATPTDIETWTQGRAIIGTGSPFPALLRNGKPFTVDQTNNSYIFPGVRLGALASHARRVSHTRYMAAAMPRGAGRRAGKDPAAHPVPPVPAQGDVPSAVAIDVALQTDREGLTNGISADEIEGAIHAKMWTPQYLPYRRA